MKFVVVECLSKECLDVFNNNATTTTICAQDRHDGQNSRTLGIALFFGILGTFAMISFVFQCVVPTVGELLWVRQIKRRQQTQEESV